MKDLVSVIIPVYKVENYLDECIASVVSQDYKNLEIILVDDGSPDNCPAMCDDWAKKDSRINVIHKENAGAADSRNKGLENANGDWILFMDSDDYYKTNDVISKLLTMATREKSDIVCFNYQRFLEDECTYSLPLCTLNGKENNIDNIIKNNIYTSSACLKLIKSDCLKNKRIKFVKETIAEDILFCAQLLNAAKKIRFCEDALYVYRNRAGSKTNSISESHIDDLYNIISSLIKEKTRHENYMDYVAYQYCTLLININFSPISQEKRRTIFDMKWLLKYDKISRVKLIHMVCNIFGVPITSKLLYWYFKKFC